MMHRFRTEDRKNSRLIQVPMEMFVSTACECGHFLTQLIYIVAKCCAKFEIPAQRYAGINGERFVNFRKQKSHKKQQVHQ